MENEVPAILWYILAAAVVLFAIIGPIWYSLWGMHRYYMRTLTILRLYAERGEEPPEAVLQALKAPDHNKQHGWEPGANACGQGRGAQLQQFTHILTIAAVAGAIAWWRSDAGGPDWQVYIAGGIAIVFAVGAFGRLVAAMAAPKSDG